MGSVGLRKLSLPWDLRKECFTARAVRPWPRLPRGAVGAPTQAVPKVRLDGVWATWSSSREAGTGDLWMSFQSEPFYGCMILRILQKPWPLLQSCLASRAAYPHWTLWWADCRPLLMLEVKDQTRLLSRLHFASFSAALLLGCCWLRECAARNICLCGADSGFLLFQPRKRTSRYSPLLPLLRAQCDVLRTITQFSLVPWTKMSAHCFTHLHLYLDLFS